MARDRRQAFSDNDAFFARSCEREMPGARDHRARGPSSASSTLRNIHLQAHEGELLFLLSNYIYCGRLSALVRYPLQFWLFGLCFVEI